MDLPQKMVLIRQINSQMQRGLQAADFIAWAFFQKYEKTTANLSIFWHQKLSMKKLL